MWSFETVHGLVTILKDIPQKALCSLAGDCLSSVTASDEHSPPRVPNASLFRPTINGLCPHIATQRDMSISRPGGSCQPITTCP